MKHLALLVLAAAMLPAQLRPPVLGYYRPADGCWHEVRGIAGNFLSGPTAQCGVQAGVSNGDLSLLAIDTGELLLMNQQGEEVSRTLGSASLLAVAPDSRSAAAWDPIAQRVSIWQSSAKAWQSYSLQSPVRALALDSNSLWLLQTDNTLQQLALADLALLSQQTLPAGEGLLQLLPSGKAFWLAPDGLHTLDNQRNEIITEAPASVTSLAPLGPSWWYAVDAAGQAWALHRHDSSWDWFLLPNGGSAE